MDIIVLLYLILYEINIHLLEMRRPPGTTLITNLGERRELHCEIPQNDRSGVRWYLNGTLVDRMSPANRTGQLLRVDYLRVSIMTISNVEDYHEGTWECRTDTESKMVDVVVVCKYYESSMLLLSDFIAALSHHRKERNLSITITI